MGPYYVIRHLRRTVLEIVHLNEVNRYDHILGEFPDGERLQNFQDFVSRKYHIGMQRLSEDGFRFCKSEWEKEQSAIKAKMEANYQKQDTQQTLFN